jgi:hypothetical protein
MKISSNLLKIIDGGFKNNKSDQELKVSLKYGMLPRILIFIVAKCALLELILDEV